LQYNPGLKSTIKTMLDDALMRSELESPGIVTMNGRVDQYCSLTVMGARRSALKAARDSTSLVLLGAQRKLAKMAKALSVHKRLVMLLEQNDVPKLRQTMGAALASGASMHSLIEKLQETIVGKYRTRGDYSNTQYDVVTLLVRLGGPKLLFALARPLGLPSLMDWRRWRQKKGTAMRRTALSSRFRDLYFACRGGGRAGFREQRPAWWLGLQS
jgi:hypothetical protein